eukprot:scaffold368_cov258-Pinguiococcus_pyrenoidosus.AAC.5
MGARNGRLPARGRSMAKAVGRPGTRGRVNAPRATSGSFAALAESIVQLHKLVKDDVHQDSRQILGVIHGQRHRLLYAL